MYFACCVRSEVWRVWDGRPLKGRFPLEKWFRAIDAEIIEWDGVWARVRRGKLTGAGQWTHIYADPGQHGGKRRPARSEFNEPAMVRRSGTRAVWSTAITVRFRPLAMDGRLFIPGDNRIVAVDAYNGAWLWDVGIPGSRRLGVMKDCGNMALSGDALYVAYRDKCCGLDVASGKPRLTFTAPALGGEPCEWGYIAAVEDTLFGSVQKKGASRTELSRGFRVGAVWRP